MDTSLPKDKEFLKEWPQSPAAVIVRGLRAGPALPWKGLLCRAVKGSCLRGELGAVWLVCRMLRCMLRTALAHRRQWANLNSHGVSNSPPEWATLGFASPEEGSFYN